MCADDDPAEPLAARAKPMNQSTVMAHSEIRAALNLFNEKADKLRNSNFVKAALENSGASLSWQEGEPFQITRTGPTEENIDAFVLTLRFFVQDNERSSFRNMSKLYTDKAISEEHRSEFEKARSYLNDFLDSSTMFNFNGKRITKRQLMEVFVFGGLSHANKQKKSLYDQWMRLGLAPLLQNEFIVIIFEVMNVAQFVKTLNERVLTDLVLAEKGEFNDRKD
jgi:hypothetical protein